MGHGEPGSACPDRERGSPALLASKRSPCRCHRCLAGRGARPSEPCRRVRQRGRRADRRARRSWRHLSQPRSPCWGASTNDSVTTPSTPPSGPRGCGTARQSRGTEVMPRRTVRLLATALSVLAVMTAGVVVGVSTSSTSWGVLAFVLAGVLTASWYLVVGAPRDWPGARHLFRRAFGERALMWLLLRGHHPRR
jgi:hypothetical protein